MTAFLTYLADQRVGIAMLLVVVGVLCLFVQWLAWTWGLGRFGLPQAARARSLNPLRYVIADLFVQIINDFRHFLALVVVTVFALMLGAAMWPGLRHGDIETMKNGLQAVAAVMAGLIGSIIGYYFGESAAGRRTQPSRSPADPAAPVQASVSADAAPADVRPAPAPPKAVEREP